MDGFTGFRTATIEELPDTGAVMDPFRVVHLAGDAGDRCRRRVPQAILGNRACTAACSTEPGVPLQPTVNERLGHRRGSALGLRNLASYIAGSLPCRGSEPQLHPPLRRAGRGVAA